MLFIDVALPATFWTHLTYSCDSDLPAGVRVLVPLGRSERVGVTVGRVASNAVNAQKIRPITKAVDRISQIPKELWELTKWFGSTWFLGTGLAAKTIFPSRFFTDEELEAITEECVPRAKYSCECIYDASDDKRYEYYISLIERGEHALILFPETELAKNFWKMLPQNLRDEGALWPASQSAAWKMWKLARKGGVRFIVGSPAAAFVPLMRLSCIVIDEENNGGWLTQKYPNFNVRSLLGKRAQFAKVKLIMGGSMPSAKCYIKFLPQCKDIKNESKLVFVSSKDALAAEFNDIKGKLPLSVPLIRETLKARDCKRWAFWIFDRKGYASSISCDECGSSVVCGRCGSGMRWNGRMNVLICKSCGQKREVPICCPNCGGKLLYGERPGLEALYRRTEAALKNKFKDVVLFEDKCRQTDENGKKLSAASLKKQFPDGALLLGTRRIISLCGELDPEAVGWIDVDSEIISDMYSAKASGFWMLWESMQRGAREERKLILQSRCCNDFWQEGLKRGWSVFWQKELRERSELGLPPFMPLIKITADLTSVKEMVKSFEAAEFDYWEVDEGESELWVRSWNFSRISKILAPYFSISAAQKTFPRVLLYLD
ncbi:MAG: hypothetical protein Q4E17_03540 [Synergistes sp.]|nr:hypothetical protein [Synergistes sp.]